MGKQRSGDKNRLKLKRTESEGQPEGYEGQLVRSWGQPDGIELQPSSNYGFPGRRETKSALAVILSI